MFGRGGAVCELLSVRCHSNWRIDTAWLASSSGSVGLHPDLVDTPELAELEVLRT
jgi:hypothetical protein